MPFGNRKRKVVEEEKYLSDLEHIIKRDFFPHSEAIELNLKYYDALDRQDFSSLKEVQMKLNLINDTFERNRNICQPLENSSTLPFKNPNIKEERDLPLDEYLSRNTSEDNDSFRDLQRKTVEKQLKKFESSIRAVRQYYEFKNIENKPDQLALEYRETEKCGSDKYETFEDVRIFNQVFFNPDNNPLSAEERINVTGRKSQINYDVFKFKSPLETVKKKSNNLKVNVPGKVGHDGREIETSTPRINGYSILGGSPSPEMTTPGLTWGEIDGKPRRLSESPALSRFYIPEPCESEKLAYELASRISKKKRLKKSEDLKRVKSAISQRMGSCRTQLTPAGLKLLAKMTPSIRRTPKNTPSTSVRQTPTPSSVRKSSITDNLLNL